MNPRHGWPRGLRILFWVAVAAALIGTSQIAYYVITAPGLFLQATMEVVYYAIAFILGWLVVLLGWRGMRRLFVVTSLVAESVHLFATVYFSAEMGKPILKSVLDGTFTIRDYANVVGWFLVWNAVGVAMEVLIFFYLVHYELRRVYSTIEPELSGGKGATDRAKV